MKIRLSFLALAVAMFGGLPAWDVGVGTAAAQAPKPPPNSYSPVVPKEAFADTVKRMTAEKPQIEKRHAALLERRYDLGTITLPQRDEPPHQVRQDARADALVGADPQRARVAGRERLQVGPGRLHAGHDPLGVAQEHLAGLGQRHPPRPPGAVDEPLPHRPLERPDLLGDRRLRVPEARRRPAEGALAGDRAQGGEVADLDAEPSITFHDRSER